MVSAWWIVWAFVIGGYAGMLLIALMVIARRAQALDSCSKSFSRSASSTGSRRAGAGSSIRHSRKRASGGASPFGLNRLNSARLRR